MIRQIYIALIFCLACLVGFGQAVSADPEKVVTINDQLDNKTAIEVYPNPAVDYLIVQVDITALSDVEFEIRSLLGSEMLVVAEDMGNGRFRFPVKDFSTGYYFVIVKDETARFKKAFRFLKSN